MKPRKLPLGSKLLSRTLLFLIAGTAGATPSSAPSWKVGVAQTKITPEKLLWMTGFGVRTHPAVGTAQDLWAKALALEDPAGHRAVLLTLDLCGITRAITDRVAAELESSHQIPRRSVAVNVSHTHSGPVVEGYLFALREYSDRDWSDMVAYRMELERRMISVAEDALRDLQPATLSWGMDTADFAVNRRKNKEAEVPALRAAGRLRGPVDHDVPVLAVRSAAGDLRAVMVSYSCHNTALMGYEWSGDYAGYAQAEIQRRHPAAIALFMQGCGGNINPLPRGQAQAEGGGRQLADAVDRALAKPMHPVDGQFSSALEDIPLPFAHPPTPAELQKASRSKVEDERVWARYFSARIKNHEDLKMTYSYPVQAWRLGGLSWVVLGGEVVVDYELRLQRETGPGVWIFGYSNDVMGYIPTEQILTEAGYEGASSMLPYGRPSPWAPGLEDKIVAAARHELEAAGAGR